MQSVQQGLIKTEFDLINTMESGQTFVWRRDGNKYYTAIDGEAVLLEETKDGLRYKTTGLPEQKIKGNLGLWHPLEKIHSSIKVEPRVRQAVSRYGGMRVVNEEFFATTISFIISSQNNIPRIKKHVQDIAAEYGEPVQLNGYTAHTFPKAGTLARAGEKELRELGLGYRAPYVVESARMIADGEIDSEKIEEMDYYDAHEEVQALYGVGDKVADCILLFSLGFLESVPIDRWIARTVKEYYPELHGETYRETADNFRERFGEYAGYAQNYLFHYIRHHG